MICNDYKMQLQELINDKLRDYTREANKFDTVTRLKFFMRFCKWNKVDGNFNWHPKSGWGIQLKEWVEGLLEEIPNSRKTILGNIYAGWDDECMKLILSIVKQDFPPYYATMRYLWYLVEKSDIDFLGRNPEHLLRFLSWGELRDGGITDREVMQNMVMRMYLKYEKNTPRELMSVSDFSMS